MPRLGTRRAWVDFKETYKCEPKFDEWDTEEAKEDIIKACELFEQYKQENPLDTSLWKMDERVFDLVKTDRWIEMTEMAALKVALADTYYEAATEKLNGGTIRWNAFFRSYVDEYVLAALSGLAARLDRYVIKEIVGQIRENFAGILAHRGVHAGQFDRFLRREHFELWDRMQLAKERKYQRKAGTKRTWSMANHYSKGNGF